MDMIATDVSAVQEGRKAGTVNIDADAMGGMIENALAFCAQKAGFREGEEALEAIRQGDCCTCSYLRYGLSKELGGYLGSIDDSVRAVYAYEPEYSTGVAGGDGVGPALERGINLIVSVDSRSAALSSVICSLEDGLKEAQKGLLCPKANGSCHALDVKVADKEELASGQGYGALISSIYVRPLRVWAREI